MPAFRVIVFGYGELALAALDTLDRLGVTPVAVVVPGNRQGTDVDMVSARARARGWRLLVQPPRKALAPFLETVSQLKPDLLLVWSYSMLLPRELIAVARLGAINLHGGLLPEYRGGHVMNWAIANGERETGVTLARIDDGIDTGPLIAERRFPIEPHDDAASIRERLKRAGQVLLEQWWPAIQSGTAPATPQDETRARYHRMRSAEDGRVDWTASNTDIHNLVRALVAPWPGAFTSLGTTRLVMRQVEPIDSETGAVLPGTVTCADESGVHVATGAGSVRLVVVEIDGRVATVADLRRAGLSEGVRFEP